MADFIYRKSEEQLQRAGKLTKIAGRIALGSLAFFILLLLVLLPLGWVFHLQSQIGWIFDYLILVVPAGLFLSAGLGLIGASTFREDDEVRRHTGNTPIINPFSQGMRGGGWIFIVFSVAVMIGGPYLVRQARNSSASTQSERESANKKRESDFKKWVDEEVAYLITPEEKQAFLMLKSDVERDSFIEQFWRDRGLKSGLGQKAYRDEHYRRFNYADSTFRLGNVPGWKTARGHIFILLGMADDLQTTSTGEVWLYANAPGFGTNVKILFTNDSDPNGFRILKKSGSR